MSDKPLLNIPTNIITGFLGVGKTTAITQLLKHKPPNERWAILVNEFGEVGIDGSLFKGGKANNEGVFVSEVPGGCMCCASGLPMQIALSLLLARAKPHRLIIEPTGLGHPKEVVQALSVEYYREVLELNSTITLVDARKLSDSRYTDNETFNQQLDIADVIIANKIDLYEEGDLPNLISYLGELYQGQDKPIFPVADGNIDIDCLSGKSRFTCKQKQSSSVGSKEQEILSNRIDSGTFSAVKKPAFNEQGYFSVSNTGEGFFSKGWVFRPDMLFDKEKLDILLSGASCERAKAVFITRDGVVSYNKVDSVLTEMALDDTLDSRIELISKEKSTFISFEKSLLDCML